MARYNITYCENKADFKAKGCKHTTTATYDGKFDKQGPAHFKGICVKCGMISTWAKVGKDGGYTLIFDK